MTPQGDTKTLWLKEMKEFGVGEDIKFARFIGLVDQSLNDEENLSLRNTPDWVKDTICLKVLIEGKAFLYRYRRGGNFQRFFFKTSNRDIEQLVYKRYRVLTSYGKSLIKKNTFFRKQLSETFKCATPNSLAISEIDYELGDMIKVFWPTMNAKNHP